MAFSMTRGRASKVAETMTRHGMVRWYNPLQLLRTGIDIFVSEELNARADPRLLEVQTGPDPDFAEGSDPVGEGGFWFDYMADTADGYAPTFAML